MTWMGPTRFEARFSLRSGMLLRSEGVSDSFVLLSKQEDGRCSGSSPASGKDSGVVDEHVDSILCERRFGGLCDSALQVRASANEKRWACSEGTDLDADNIGHVESDGLDAALVRLDEALKLSRGCWVANSRDNTDLGAGSKQLSGEFETQAARSSGDEVGRHC